MKMTSRIYGIAVKETVNYYDFDEIRIQFNQDTKHWSIFSNYDNIWYNGTNYTKGQLILMFSDYTVAEYKIMAQHTEVSPYVNYMYVVTTNAEINPASIQNGKVEYVFEADPENEPYQFTCKMLINNDVQKTHTVTDVDIKNYKNKTNGQLPTLFYNLKMDWHGMNPESPYLPYSFTIISNSNYIKDGTAPRQVGEIVLQIPAGVGQSSYYHKILDETNKHEAKKNADSLPVIKLAKYKGGALVNPTGKKTTFTRETIIQKVYHDHTKVYYNGHYHRAMYCVVDSTGFDIGCWKKNFKGLAFTYADPFWFCMTTSAGFEYGGRVLEAKKLVKCWKGTDPINLTLSKTTSRKKPAPDDAPYDDIIYDVVSNDVNVTVTRIRRKTHIDASGHKTTEDIQEGLPIVFDTSSSPVLCWNIEFRASNNVWTIYSKCGYIRYNGRQYQKNRSILDFNAGEEMHIEIKDETEKYEVDEVVTYTISNVTATAFIYKLWTVGTSYTLKVEKSVPGEDPEPWVTVNFYDAIYDPVIIDDIQISFDNSKRIWKLVSRSDDLYYYDKKLAYGDLIAEWGLNTVFSLRDNNALKVILPNPSMDIRVKSQSNKVDFKGVDISDFIPRDLNEASYLDILVVHSVTKGVWTVTSKNDNTYVSGTRYTYNKEIFSCPDKQGMPEIDIMCQHKRDESGQPISPTENWHYFISISYDSYEQMGTMVINCKKMATAPQTGWVTIFSQTYYSREKEDPEYQNRTTMIITKENSKSMYGYIWKRDMPGPGPGPSEHYCWYIVPVSIQRINSGSGYKYLIVVRVESGHRFIKKIAGGTSSNLFTQADEVFTFSDYDDGALILFYSDKTRAKYYYNGFYGSDGVANPSNWVDCRGQWPPPGSTYSRPYYALQLKLDGKNTILEFGDITEGIDPGARNYIRVNKLIISDTFNIVLSESYHETDNPDRIMAPALSDYRQYNDWDTTNHIPNNYRIGNNLILFGSFPFQFYNDDTYEDLAKKYVSVTLDLDTLIVTPRHKYILMGEAADFRVKVKEDAKRIFGPDVSVQDWPSLYTKFQSENYLLCTIEIDVAPRGGIPGYVTFIYAYQYNVITGTYIDKGIYFKGSYGNVKNTFPWRWGDKTRELYFKGKYYYYYDDPESTNIDIIEINDKDDFNELFSGGTKVRSISENSSIQVYDIINRIYRTFTINEMFPVDEIGGFIDTKYYNGFTNNFNTDGGNYFIRFFDQPESSVQTADPWIVFLPDPLLNNLSTAFCFKSSDFRSRSEYDEDND